MVTLIPANRDTPYNIRP